MNMPSVLLYVLPVISALVFSILGWNLNKSRSEKKMGDITVLRDRMIKDAENEAGNIRKDAQIAAKEEFYESRQRFEQDTAKARKETLRRQESIDLREENLNKKVSFLDKKEHRLDALETDFRDRLVVFEADEKKVAGILREQNDKLEEIAGLTSDHAKKIIMQNMVNEARMAAAKSIQQIREETERTSKQDAIKILSLAIQRYGSEHVAESTVSVVDLPNDEMKGRIIGREGRNIRSFEMTTGIDVIIDDTPGAVIVSGFDPVRREIARQSLEILVRDGRIHPARIEEVVAKVGQEMAVRIREIGEQACLEVGLHNVRPEMIPYIGRLRYRTSYGQNLLKHSMEVAAVSAVIASELGLDARLARRCGFFHDIGKAADHEVDGPHAVIGARMCKKFGENDTVINAVGGHHQDVEPTTPYTFITSAADAVSASRPGARREAVQTYVERLENLENIADSFDGVEKSFAIQAGREVRVLVHHSKVSDAETAMLAEEISRRVEGELEYPGQIKVMVIRETRSTAVAK